MRNPKPRCHTPGLLLLVLQLRPLAAQFLGARCPTFHPFDLIFLVVSIPFLIREFTYPDLLTSIILRALGLLGAKEVISCSNFSFGFGTISRERRPSNTV